MSIKIVTDSTCDLPRDIVEKRNITVVPLSVNFNGDSYLDGIDLTNEEFYKKLEESENLPTTSQVNPGTFVEIFKEITEKGDEVLGIFLAKEFSGTYASAEIAKDILNDERIHLIDSRGVTGALASIVLAASDLIEKENNTEKIINKLKDLISKNKSIIIVDTLKYLLKGGRISKSQAVVGSVLSIKPVLKIEEGELIKIDTIRGKSKGVKRIVDWVKEEGFDLSDKRVLILDTNDKEYHEKIKNALIDNFKIGEIVDIEVGSVVGTHGGPGCGGMCFINEKL